MRALCPSFRKGSVFRARPLPRARGISAKSKGVKAEQPSWRLGRSSPCSSVAEGEGGDADVVQAGLRSCQSCLLTHPGSAMARRARVNTHGCHSFVCCVQSCPGVNMNLQSELAPKPCLILAGRSVGHHCGWPWRDMPADGSYP